MARNLSLVGVIAAALATSSAPALAAPAIDRSTTLTASAPSFAWDGQEATAAAPQQSAVSYDPANCTKEPDYYCDVTLVRVDAAKGTTADLEFAIFDFSVPIADFDLSIFRSDASGEPGEFLANGGNLSAAGLEETVPIEDAEPGYYLATVSYYFSPGASYKGTVKATGIVAPKPAAKPTSPAAPTPVAPQPSATPPPAPARFAMTVSPVRRGARAVRVKVSAATTVTVRDARGRRLGGARAAKAGTVTVRLRRRVTSGRLTVHAGGLRRVVRIR